MDDPQAERERVYFQPPAKPVVSLTCCCCGKSTQGRQWYNRDKGYGLCANCAEWIKSRGTSAEEMQSLYGIKGTHYDLG